jgi:hypothetical protein
LSPRRAPALPIVCRLIRTLVRSTLLDNNRD